MPLRQTTGFVQSLLRLVGLDWATPDFSTLCRRQQTLNVSLPHLGSTGLLNLLIDSTGIKAEGVNAGPKLHRTPERKCTIWLDLAGVKLRQLVGFRFVHGPARRSAPTKQRSCAGLWSNRGAVFALQALRDCRLCLRR